MVVERDPGEWFLGGTMPAFAGPPPYGWVERIQKTEESPAEQGIPVERTTRFEPATLTLARYPNLFR